MKVERWNQLRSDFNHGWLKNRLIVALHRAARIASGAIVEERGLGFLGTLLAEWPERHQEAKRLITEYSKHGVEPGDGDEWGGMDYVTKVGLMRWQETEDPAHKAKLASDALEELDAEINRVEEFSRETIRGLCSKAQALADAFSKMKFVMLPNG